MRYQFRSPLHSMPFQRSGAFAVALFCALAGDLNAQGSARLLASRAELTAAATAAEVAATSGDPSQRTENAVTAAAIRQRLRDGDLREGDRVVVTILSDALHRDTVVVRAGRVLELPGMIVVPVGGVLRSELQERVTAEVRKYVKAQQVDVTLLMRVGILGAVAKPGYFALASDVPLADAIMAAGGPTTAADMQKSVVRRQNQEFRSAKETGRAIAGGLTLDQIGMATGDELVVGQRRDFSATTVLGIVGALASVMALVVASGR